MREGNEAMRQIGGEEGDQATRSVDLFGNFGRSRRS